MQCAKQTGKVLAAAKTAQRATPSSRNLGTAHAARPSRTAESRRLVRFSTLEGRPPCRPQGKGRDRAYPAPPMIRSLTRARLVVLLVVMATTLPLRAEQSTCKGTVEFSDGTMVSGTISAVNRNGIRILAGNKLRELPLKSVSQIAITPEKEDMEQKWRFVEAGQTRKETWGKPFPVRHYGASVILSDGTAIDGHLYTTAILVEHSNTVTKVVLRSKQRGKQGESLDDLVYPRSIVLDNAAETVSSRSVIGIPPKMRIAGMKVACIDLNSMQRSDLAWRPDTEECPVLITGTIPPLAATMTGNTVTVGWPSQTNTALATVIASALDETRDFFDTRKLLGIYCPAQDGDIYTLLLLSRAAPTTLPEKESLPWRIAVWRWARRVDEPERLMLAGRSYFFRGIRNTHEPLPEIDISEDL